MFLTCTKKNHESSWFHQPRIYFCEVYFCQKKEDFNKKRTQYQYKIKETKSDDSITLLHYAAYYNHNNNEIKIHNKENHYLSTNNNSVDNNNGDSEDNKNKYYSSQSNWTPFILKKWEWYIVLYMKY